MNRVNSFQISFQSFGVKIGVRADSRDLLSAIEDEMDKINPHGFEVITDVEAAHLFEIKSKPNKVVEITKAGDLLWNEQKNFLPYLQSQIRLTIAEYAERRVFLHAGAVGWKGRAIVMPGTSFSGKSTLVAELIRRGASYYSDDFAVLDDNGMVHPFHRQLSLRVSEDRFSQVDIPIEALGGIAGFEPLPVGIVLMSQYKKEYNPPKKWKPEILSGGQGIMEILSHTIPIRHKPKFSLEVLNKVAECAIICKSQRGKAEEFADLLLNFIQTQVIK